MRQFIIMSGVCVFLSACSGDDLDTPIKTCKSVTTVLVGAALPSTVEATQKDEDDRQLVTLGFQLSDEQRAMNVVCTYRVSPAGGEDSGVELFGKYERVPSAMDINGQAVRTEDLFRAINTATVTAGKKVVKEANDYLQKQ